MDLCEGPIYSAHQMSEKRSTPRIMRRAGELRLNPTPAEAKLWSRLRAHRLSGVGFRRQHAIGNYRIYNIDQYIYPAMLYTVINNIELQTLEINFLYQNVSTDSLFLSHTLFHIFYLDNYKFHKII